MDFYKTPQVATMLGVTLHRIIGLLRYGRIERPQKDFSGDYQWSRENIAAARRALAAQDRKARRTPAPAGRVPF
jgi:hypothetical protein